MIWILKVLLDYFLAFFCFVGGGGGREGRLSSLANLMQNKRAAVSDCPG